jgi:hypothetical protein
MSIWRFIYGKYSGIGGLAGGFGPLIMAEWPATTYGVAKGSGGAAVGVIPEGFVEGADLPIKLLGQG